MRIPSLFVLLLAFLLAASTALSQAPASTKSSASSDTTTHKSQRPQSGEQAKVTTVRAPTWTGDLVPTCLSIRRYRVKREAPDSDVTRVVAYTTCVPTRNIAIMNADAH